MKWNQRKMKSAICSLLFAAMLFNLSACGTLKDRDDKAPSVQNKAGQTEEAMEQTAESEASAGESRNGKILIAYFAVAENSGVDTVSSASIVSDDDTRGRMQALAEMIQAETGGDLFSIQTSVEYPEDIGELIDYASTEQEENARPKLTSQIENPHSYDTVFVGYPTWWYDLPQIMYSFFEAYDFSGKTIIPFNSHNGSRFSGTIDTIKELEPDAEVIEDGFTVNERDVEDSAADLADWLREIGY